MSNPDWGMAQNSLSSDHHTEFSIILLKRYTAKVTKVFNANPSEHFKSYVQTCRMNEACSSNVTSWQMVVELHHVLAVPQYHCRCSLKVWCNSGSSH